MTENEIYRVVVPDVPDVIPDQELYVFVPKANANAAGVVWPSDDFVFGTDGKLHVNEDKFVKRFIGNTTHVVYSETYAQGTRQLVGVRLSNTLDTSGYYSIPYRDPAGRFQVGTPSGDKDVVNKEYADTKVAKVQFAVDPSLYEALAYVVTNNGLESTIKIGQRTNTVPDTLVIRNIHGSIYMPTPIEDYEAANKQYVDTQIVGANNYTDQQIQELKDNPDVVDIVATYADLLSYDTTNLGNKDIIRVLSDESQQGGGKSTYYKWNYPNAGWNFVGMLTGESGTTVYVNNVSQPTWNADTKLDKKTSSGTVVYAVNGQNQVMMGVSMDAVSGSIAQRDMSGRLKVAPPTEDTHAANKAYVDSSITPAIEVIGYGRY